MVLAPKKDKQPSIHHRKRTGDHHKRTKPYHKTYWPYLPLLAIAGFALLLNIVWSNLGLHAGSVLGASDGLSSQQLLVATNHDRAELGISALDLDSRLSAAAQAKAQDMVARGYWAHVSPDGRQPWSFATNAGYDYRALGENLAYGFDGPSGVVKGWMDSTEHRDNMLDPAYSDVGFGVVRAADYQGKGPQTVVVALYGAPAGSFGVTATVNNPTVLPARTVARTSQLFGTAVPWLNGTLLTVAALGAAWLIARHVRALHRVINYGEEFVLKHPHLDLAITGAVVTAVLLTRSAGFIH